MNPRRSLQTILFTDIVGSTERAVELGDRAWHEVLDEHNAAVRREIRRFGGREINTTGDGFLAAFPRPALAIRCAAAIRESVEELDLEIRAGVHMGAVEHHGKDLGGVGVHIGARIAGEAGPGEILVSNAVRESETGSGFTFADRGERELKGIPGEWRLHAVESVPAGGWVPWTARWLPAWVDLRTGAIAAAVALVLLSILTARAYLDGDAGVVPVETAAAAPAIAVLPFEVRGGEEQAVWREGMVDALSTNLDGVTGLRAVDSRALLVRWRDAAADGSAEIATALGVARDLGARYAVTGSLIETGDDLRLVAEAYDVETGRSLGRSRVEGAADSVLALVDRLSVAILREVGTQAGDLEGIELARVTTRSLPALRAYLRGEGHLRASRFESAAEAFREAVEDDSLFGLAWMRLAEALNWTAPSRMGEAMDPAFRLADRMPEREALIARAWPHARLGAPEGLALLREATRRYPQNAWAWFRLGEYMYHQGPGLLADPAETRRAFTRAVELDPGYTPAYFHAIDLQMRLAPDSAAVMRWFRPYADLAAGSEDEPQFRALVSYAFGTDSTRTAVLAALDTLSPNPFWVYLNYSHPRFFSDKARILRILRERPAPGLEDEFAAWIYASGLFDMGRIDEALEAIAHPKVAGVDWGGRLYLARQSGLPVPVRRLDRALAGTTAIDPARPTTPGLHANREAEVLFARAAWALDRDRPDDYATWSRRGREIAAGAWAEADTGAARYADGVVLALEGLETWKEGDLELADAGLDEARLVVNGSGGIDPVKKIVRWWLARLALERGREERAARILLTLAHGEDGVGDPLAMLELARVQERLGRLEEAQANYELFVLAWEEADPELWPLVEEALDSAARVEGRNETRA